MLPARPELSVVGGTDKPVASSGQSVSQGGLRGLEISGTSCTACGLGEGGSLLQGTEKHPGSLEHWWDHGKENRKERLQRLEYEDRRDRRGKCRDSNPESPAGQDPVLGALPVSLFRLAFLEIYHLHALRSELKQCKAGAQPEW